MSLVADYSDSSDSATESNNNDSSPVSTPSPEKPLPKLPSASSALASTPENKKGKVLSNPFLEAEMNKTASLERHVKMVDNNSHTQLKNGRKICWNYRKGRCRFGTNCQYAHDSDLSVTQETTESKLTEPKAPTLTGSATDIVKQRKRPGLGDALTPSKRVMKAYQKQNN